MGLLPFEEMKTDRQKLMRKLAEEGKTYSEIGRFFNISRARVHQLLTGYKSPLAKTVHPMPVGLKPPTAVRLRLHKITPKDYERMLTAQGNTCPLCLRQFTVEVDPCIDHSHDTGIVRGLLCRRCNVNLAAVEDEAFLARARTYLQDKSHVTESQKAA